MNAAVLPRQVQAQLDEAERIQASLEEQPTSLTEIPAEPHAPPPAAPAAVVEPPPQPVVPEQHDAAIEWKARFDALQGKYNSEIPRMHEEARARDAQIHAMQRQMNDLTARTPAPPKPEPLVTSQDEEKFGSDLVDVMRRVSKEQAVAFNDRLGAMERAFAAIAPQVRQVEQVGKEVTDQKQERYWSALDQNMPDWQAVNADPQWIAWLAQHDVVAGRTRQEVLNDASTALDYRRVIAMFQLFKDAVGGAPSAAPAPAAPARPSAQSELARQVAPARSSTTTTRPQGVKTFSGKDYTYWVDPRRVHDTPPAKLDQALNEMESALAEGRIKW